MDIREVITETIKEGKVEGELPEDKDYNCYFTPTECYKVAQEQMLNAGYTKDLPAEVIADAIIFNLKAKGIDLEG